jgi:hypothetical protein
MMRLIFKNNGAYAQVKIDFENGWTVDLGLLSVDEAIKAHTDLRLMADRLGTWIRGHGVKDLEEAQ